MWFYRNRYAGTKHEFETNTVVLMAAYRTGEQSHSHAAAPEPNTGIRIDGGGANAFSKYERGGVTQSVAMNQLGIRCQWDGIPGVARTPNGSISPALAPQIPNLVTTTLAISCL